MQDRPAPRAGYQDPLVSIQDGELVIRRYYFPTRPKRIRLAGITRGGGVRHDQGHRQVADLGLGRPGPLA